MSAGLAALLSLVSVHGAVLNLTNTPIAGHAQSTLTAGSIAVVGGFLNGALYRRPTGSDDSGAGSGVFRDLYRVDDNSGVEDGYNRKAVFDTDVPNGFDPVITVDDLVEDRTGTAYVFVVDTNEPGNATTKHISLDDFRIYVGGTTDPDPLPTDLNGVENDLGLNVYSMNKEGEDNHVLLDYSLFSGSGQMDLFVFVPKAYFAGLAGDSLVYIYSEFGSYTEAPGFDAAAGPEQVSLPGRAVSGTVDPLVAVVPEPALSVLLAVAVLFGWRRRR